jgi:Tfp pilus assembly protein PilE
MNFTMIGLVVAAIIVGILYMQRRRARLSQED